jgi:glycosyltransferase involved in cell wall biosynthesis
MEAFTKRGYDTSLITDSNCWVAPEIRFTPVYALPTMSKENFLGLILPNILATASILRKIEPDIVHLHAQHYLCPAIILNNLPYILTSWGVEVLNLPRANFFFQSWAKITAKKAKMITVDAKLLKDLWIKNGIPADKIKVIPFGVDTNLFNSNIDGTAVRKKFQIEDNDTVVISTRPFYNHHYDVERLIRAIPLVSKNHSNVKFIIKGRGPLEDYLKSLAEKLTVSEHIRFVGLTQYNEMGQYLSAANIYVSTCFMDTTSVSLLEAMACGLAPVVTDTIGNREWIEDNVNGFLFPPMDHKKLAEKISQLIENKPLTKSFGERCAEIVKEKANWKKNVAEMEAIYEANL